MSESLTITNVSKAYTRKKVLDSLSFKAEAGEFIVLVGPSGCGKSTMLRSIAGLEQVTSGSIHIGDRDVTHLPPKDRNIAMVFQDYALYPHKSVYENIAFGLRIRRFPGREIDRLVREAADKLRLTPYLERKPAALSGGQRQRVAIGRAIVRKPSVFLFDEPLSNLDAKLRGSMRISIAKLHKELNATIVYVTHDQVEAMTLADKIIVLDRGKIQQMGSPLELYHYPANTFVATFIGSPAMNLLDGAIEMMAGKPWFVSDRGLRFPIPERFGSRLGGEMMAGRKVVWGVRPEDFSLASGHGLGQTSDWLQLQARVDVTELLGPTTSVICDAGGHELHVTLPAPHRPMRGSSIEIEHRAEQFYLFDKDTGLALLSEDVPTEITGGDLERVPPRGRPLDSAECRI